VRNGSRVAPRRAFGGGLSEPAVPESPRGLRPRDPAYEHSRVKRVEAYAWRAARRAGRGVGWSPS